MQKNDCNLIVFLKYPEEGNVKTRLAADIGNKHAVDVYIRITKNIINRLSTGSYDITICFDPAEKVNEIKSWIEKPDFNYVPQKGDNLGLRMVNAFEDSFLEGYNKTAIIGTDCPDLTNDLLTNSFDTLDNSDLVLGPSTDGGYYLIGLCDPRNSLFEDINWSTDKVLRQTIKKATALKLNYKLLDFKTDIDTAPDLNEHRYLID